MSPTHKIIVSKLRGSVIVLKWEFFEYESDWSKIDDGQNVKSLSFPDQA